MNKLFTKEIRKMSRFSPYENILRQSLFKPNTNFLLRFWGSERIYKV